MPDEQPLGIDRILLLGRQGAGKGLLGRLLASSLGAEFLSMGDVLRSAARADTPLGRTIARTIDAGKALPPDMSYGLLEAALATRRSDGPLVLDGVPHLANQVDRVRAVLGGEPTAAIVLELPTPIAVERLLKRVTCESCAWPHGPGWPSKDGRCTQCGGLLSPRADDTVMTIAHRHETWGMEARSIVRYYETLGVVRRIRADTSISTVVEGTLEVLAR